ncbi:SPOR domain-containing protein [Pseudoxanthomonas sangjuensis]|uniref:SPOR domain-containing protein n=1 Tax=Pseudoxanthomonas sangjuensis TaxID=1503750 RepID=UPI0013920B2F|nr:SPOR domain-containing protein [Pseudoxanthomonas sangjuensis]KAF1714764.1 sporulation protein [Pseudoxanthomonas sangjuensis]
MDTPLKQRLIGAVVLVALAVIFLPMLIKGPAPDSGVSDVPLKVPEEPAGQFVEIPLNAPGNAPEGGAVGLQAPVDDAAPATPAENPGAMLPAAVAGGDYAVSFGAYASQADADAVIARLKQSRLPGYSVADLVNGQPAWRVRIGPYADRAQAEIVRLEAVKVRDDVKAQVVVLDADAESASAPRPAVAAQPVRTEALPPEPARPAPAKAEPAKPVAAAPQPPAPRPEPAKPAASGTGFAVQLGAFSSSADAIALRDKARASGFSAFVEQVRTDKGTLSRVRVGPVASRDDADKLKAQVAAKLGVNGMVRPHP